MIFSSRPWASGRCPSNRRCLTHFHEGWGNSGQVQGVAPFQYCAVSVCGAFSWWQKGWRVLHRLFEEQQLAMPHWDPQSHARL